MSMKVLIIGGTGNISTPITKILVDRGDEVTVYNRGNRQSRVPETVKLITGDRRNYSEFEKQMASAGRFDCVIDMIGFIPEEVESAIRVFRGRTKQYIFCSTVDVYTKQAKNYPIKEDAEKKPFNSFPYAFDKAICENLLFEAHKQGAFNVTIFRPAQTYSEGGSPLVHAFRGGTYNIDRLRKGKPIIIQGDGSSIWVACHSDDVARAFVNAVGNKDSFGKAYNVTGEELMTYNYYWKSFAEVMGAPEPKIVHIPTDLLGKIAPELASWCVENFQYNNIFDNSAARKDLDFQYRVTWKEGVKRCLDWLEEYGEIEDSDNYDFYDEIIEAWERLTNVMSLELKGKEGIK